MDESYSGSVTAVAGGGQSALATITTTLTRIGTVATAGDSLTLPKAAPGLRYKVKNAAASNSANIFPFLGDQINALAVNSAFALASAKSAEFVCITAGIWDTFPTVAS